MAPFDIQVNAIAPGFFRTALGGGRLLDETATKPLEAIVPMKRIAMPREIAGVSLLLASPAAATSPARSSPSTAGSQRHEAVRGRVAVVTGAGSGIGRELAIACAERGMKLVLSDVDVEGLAATKDLISSGIAVRTRQCDVSSFEAVQDLANLAFGEFGYVHLLFNNAGVAALGPLWSATPQDWKWVLGVNLLGVANGIQSFVPRMIAAGQDGHVVNTSSGAGLTAVAGSGVYCASKHAVVALSECLLKDFETAG